uniref:Uncharacterized protein n=1 Tax=Brassica oleracea var. oleracea TaxID=109376 RepID=A0A0D3D3I8_BRAOL
MIPFWPEYYSIGISLGHYSWNVVLGRGLHTLGEAFNMDGSFSRRGCFISLVMGQTQKYRLIVGLLIKFLEPRDIDKTPLWI